MGKAGRKQTARKLAENAARVAIRFEAAKRGEFATFQEACGGPKRRAES